VKPLYITPTSISWLLCRPGRVEDYTVDADVGIALIENVCLGYYLCLPNKLFEYVACGVPAVCQRLSRNGALR